MKIYLSHAIRGAKGLAATSEDMAENCRKAEKFACLIRMNLSHKVAQGEVLALRHADGHVFLRRDTELYVPAEHEDFVGRAYRKGYITETQILDIDCDILLTCDAVIAFGPISRGMRVEIECAEDNNIPVYYIEE